MELTRRSLLSLAAAGAALGGLVPLCARASESAGSDAAAEEPAGTITAAPGSADAAAQLMAGIEGAYEPLFDVYARYPELWEEYAAQVVGEEAAPATAKMLLGSCQGELTGPDAVEAYAADPDATAFSCAFPEGVATLEVGEGGVVSGYDADGAEVFSHTYAYLCYAAEAGWYAYRTDDEDAGEFRYFLALPDTPADTYHIEFRMGSDLNDLFDYYTGAYAYWMGAGIPVDHDDEMVASGIELFVTENLAGE